MSWDELATIINAELGNDDRPLSEAAYRRPYQQAKRFFEANVFGGKIADNPMFTVRQDIVSERVKLQDERAALNKQIRDMTRDKQNLNHLEKVIGEQGKRLMPAITTIQTEEYDNDMVICVSDLHLGLTYANYFGSYNAEIAAERMAEYLKKIVQIKAMNKSENAYVLLLGDMCNGNIHMTTQLQNRENVIGQTQKAAELLSEFAYELSKIFKSVTINSVAGNHSRVGLKENVLRDERLDDIIPWYMEANLRHIENVRFAQSDNFDPTIAKIEIRGNYYFAVHGDFDAFSDNGVHKLTFMTGVKPKAVFMGHKHKNGMEGSDVKIIMSGSFAGSGDDYCVTKRLYGKPCQMVSIVNDYGVVSCYPINFEA